jgi:hypothetical protein
MHSELRAQAAFRLTGLRAEGLAPPDARALRPALMARLRDLATLRYDFPVLLLANPQGDTFARPLREVFDELLAADGPRELLRLEREIRALLAEGNAGTLAKLWPEALARIEKLIEPAAAMRLATLCKSLKVDGELAACDAAFPRRYVRHAWAVLHQRKAARFHAEAQRLLAALRDILAADEARSPHGRSAPRLRETVGSLHRESFDFDAMSKLLQRAPQRRALTDARRRRIRSLIATLESQRFFTEDHGRGFVFDRCAAAVTAFHARAGSLRAVSRALAIARLEAAGEYEDAVHRPIFRRMRESALAREELARFPDYLVFLHAGELTGATRGELLDLLASGLPAKIVVQHDDLLDETLASDGFAAAGARAQALAGAAQGLGDVFVVQASSSTLPRLAGDVREALGYADAAFLNLYSGAGGATASLPAYLVAAAATESRVFPAYTCDPREAPERPRYAISCNPQPDLDWPLHPFDYESADHQRAHREMAFTAADFIAMDPRFGASFQWLQGPARALPVAECLDGEVPIDAAAVVSVVDEADQLRELTVEQTILELSHRCRHAWRALQQMARGPAPEARAQPEVVQAPAPEAAPAAAPAPATPAPAAEAKSAPGEPYIETPRCTTCNECTTINNKMFAYDGNKQAYIADLSAGTYRQLVEAAESCQVSIIHPGKPRDPGEAGLEELLERAAPFL